MINLSFMKNIPMFNRLSDQALKGIGAALKTRTLAAGEILFNLGDLGDELFIVETGSLAIFVPDAEKPGTESPIRIFGPCEMFGEMALIDQQPRSLSARALEESQVLILTGNDFRDLLRDYPDIALQVMAGLSDRIRYTTDFLGEVQEWVKRVAEGKYHKEFKPSTNYNDRSMEELAAEFAQMAAQVQQREEELRQEIIKLQVKIDDEKRQRQVSEITGTDYFNALRSRAKELRQQNAEKETEE